MLKAVLVALACAAAAPAWGQTPYPKGRDGAAKFMWEAVNFSIFCTFGVVRAVRFDDLSALERIGFAVKTEEQSIDDIKKRCRDKDPAYTAHRRR